MANKEHVERLKRSSVDEWNVWRKENPTIRPNLSEADLRYIDLEGVDLHIAHFRRTNLRGANLRSTGVYHTAQTSQGRKNTNGIKEHDAMADQEQVERLTRSVNERPRGRGNR